MGVVNALLISAWALGLMGVWIWSVYDGANAAGHGWRITAVFVCLTNLAVVGGWLRGLSMPGGVVLCMAFATGASLAIVFAFWLRMKLNLAQVSFRRGTEEVVEKWRDERASAKTPSPVPHPTASPDAKATGERAGGYFLMTFGAIFAAAGVGVVVLGFTSRHGSPLLAFRLDHPAFLVAMAGVVIGAGLALIGRSVIHHADGAS